MFVCARVGSLHWEGGSWEYKESESGHQHGAEETAKWTGLHPTIKATGAPFVNTLIKIDTM